MSESFGWRRDGHSRLLAKNLRYLWVRYIIKIYTLLRVIS